MLRPSLTKPTITCNRKCLFQRPQYSSVTSRKKFATSLADEIKIVDEPQEDGFSVELPTNPLYTKEVSELLVASRDRTARRVWGLTSTNFNPWEKFIAVWQNLVAIRRALLVRDGSLPPDADALSFPNLHTYFVNHKRFLATKIMRNKLPPQYRAFVLNWDIQNRTKLRDEHMLEFLFQKYPDCFPKGYIEKIVTTYSTSRTDSASSRELLVGQIPKWIERMGVLKSLDWNRERTIALMAYSARTDDVKLFTELLNDFMAHETNPASAWKGIKDILASETSEQTLKDLYEAALSAKMVTPDLTWGIVLGLNRFKNTKAILDLMQKAVKSDPEVISPQAFDVAVQALVNEGDVENAYALFILRPDQTEENYHGYKKTRTMLLLEMSKQGYTKRMLELYEKSWQGAVPPDSFSLQTLLTYFIEVGNDQLVEYFWNQFKQRNLVVGPICYNLMAKHYLQKNEPEKVKAIAEELRETSEEGSRSRMVFGTARISHALHQGNFDEALSLYHKMVNPDAAVFSKIIPGLLKAGRVEEAKIEIDRLKAKVQQEEKNQEPILKKAEAINVVAHYNLMKHQSIAEIFTRPPTAEEKDEEEN